MHRYFRWAAGALAIVSMVACHKDEEEEKVKLSEVTIYASVDNEVIKDADGSTAYAFQLADDDSLKVCFGKSSRAVFTYSAGTGQSASFTSESASTYVVPSSYDDFYKAIYPNSVSPTVTSDSLTTSITSKQTASESITRNMLLLMGNSDNENIRLYNTLSYLSFSVNRDDIVSVAFYANSSDAKLTGSASFSFDGSGVPYVASCDKAENSITAVAPEDFFEPGKNYYVRVLPASLGTSGYTMMIQTKTGSYQKSVSSALTFTRNNTTAVSVSTDGAAYYKSSGAVSVSSSKIMFFATGNLCFDSSANSWKIAAHQYDIASDASDLFAWTANSSGSGSDEADSETFNDWGANTVLSSDGTVSYPAGTWTTPRAEDFRYIVNSRKCSTVGKTENARYVKATVCGIPGLLIFPDEFTWPSDLSLPAKINVYNADFASNIYTEDQFTLLDAEGVAFLPCAGFKKDGAKAGVNIYGFYWTSDFGNLSTSATSLVFSINTLALNSLDRVNQYSVRLIRGWAE